MGGCRCSYRNCSVRSDGQTHQFHFPVFDKMRCHQWLTNAQKLEFLNLKVSQLKNRVVCQNHFRNEYFMNFKKDKLTFNAVPTEDGPYCNSSEFDDVAEYDTMKAYGITVDDIENENYMTLNEKKANFSVKYGDFLTNCDVMDINILNHNGYSQNDSKDKVKDPDSIILNGNINRKPYSNIETELGDMKPRVFSRRRGKNTMLEGKMKQKEITAPTALTQWEELVPSHGQNTHQDAGIKKSNESNLQEEITPKSLPKENKIKIISEKKIREPVPLKGTLEPLSPSTVLPLPKKKRQMKTNVVDPNDMKDNMIEIAIDNPIQDNVKPLNSMPIIETQNNIKPLHKPVIETSSEQTKTLPSTRYKKKYGPNKIKNDVQTNTSFIKSKGKLPQVSPERVAAIDKKRKFNMKLRDIIESCLDKLDDQEKISENTNCLQSVKKKVDEQQQVASYLATGTKLPHVDQYAIAYLEERMKKMEDNLVNKINQNSKRIIDLKTSFSPPTEKKTVYTQTLVSEEAHKKQLYQDISKYLSPDANSLIYEELFINRYVQNVPKILPSGKRRRCT